MRYERDGYSVEAGLEKRRKLPPDHWYFNQPELPSGSDFFLEAYRDLATCRLNDGNGPIPWTAAALYADKAGLARDVAWLLWSVIRVMDLTERRWVSASAAGQGETGKGDAKL